MATYSVVHNVNSLLTGAVVNLNFVLKSAISTETNQLCTYSSPMSLESLQSIHLLTLQVLRVEGPCFSSEQFFVKEIASTMSHSSCSV